MPEREHVEMLAKILHEAMEKLDHATGKDWDALEERDREFCRLCIMALARKRDIWFRIFEITEA